MVPRSGKLTIGEIEPDHSPIRDPPVVNRLTLPYDRISQRREIPDCGARPKILEVWCRGSALTMRREVFEILFGRAIFRVQFIEIAFVELSGDRFVDIGDRGVIPEFGIFLCGIETIDLSRADDDIRSVNRIEER